MEIVIDEKSGFCFGVVNAIRTAEKYLQQYGNLFCLGDIVHNQKEVARLQKMGLVVVNHADLPYLFNTRLLIRAHGEPPSTYQTALQNHIEIIDASCPVVLRLQNKIKDSYRQLKPLEGQVLIFGKHGHAEVNGLKGQTDNQAIVVGADFKELEQVDFSKPIHLFSQTTQNTDIYEQLILKIKQKMHEAQCGKDGAFHAFHTICGQVSGRKPRMEKFAREYELIIFVSGPKSSNGKYLFRVCKDRNPHTYIVSGAEDIRQEWFDGVSRVGISGATSTPRWLMEEVAARIRQLANRADQNL